MEPTGISNLYLWLDAMDTTTFVKGSGDDVLVWSSKVPTETTPNETLGLSGKPRSVVSNGLNNHLAMRCIDRKSSLGITNFNVPLSFPLTLFLVVSHIGSDETLDNTKVLEIGFNGVDPNVKNYLRTTKRKTTNDIDDIDISYTYFTEVLFKNTQDGGSFFSFESSGHDSDIEPLMVYELHARSSNDFNIFVSTIVSGVVQTDTVEFGLPDAPPGVWTTFLESIINTTFGFFGDIGEVIIYRRDLTLTESQSILTYIFERWV